MSSNDNMVKYSKKEAEVLAKKQDPLAKVLATVFSFAQKNSKLIVGVLVLAVVAGLGLGINETMTLKREAALQERYAQAEKDQLEKERGFEEAERAALHPEKDKKPDAKTPAGPTGDLEKDHGTSVKTYTKVIREAPTSKAARMSAIKLSDLYIKYKKPEDALKSLQDVTSRMNHDLTGYLVTFQKANVQAQLGQCADAVATWESITKAKQAAFLRKEAQVRMGLCYESLKDPAKAELMYLEASKKDDQSDMGPAKDAEKYLRLLKLKKTESKGS